MLVRISWHKPSAIAGLHSMALVLASLLSLSAVLSFSITLWGLAVDLGWAMPLPSSMGISSHWQFWVAGSALILFAGVLDGYSRLASKYSADC